MYLLRYSLEIPSLIGRHSLIFERRIMPGHPCELCSTGFIELTIEMRIFDIRTTMTSCRQVWGLLDILYQPRVQKGEEQPPEEQTKESRSDIVR
jgi:hypothetical protein